MPVTSRQNLSSLLCGFVGVLLGFCTMQASVCASSSAKPLKVMELQVIGPDGAAQIVMKADAKGPAITLQDQKKERQICLDISTPKIDSSSIARLEFKDLSSKTTQVQLFSGGDLTALHLRGVGWNGPGPIDLFAHNPQNGQATASVLLGDLTGNKIWLNADDRMAEVGMHRPDRTGLNMVTRSTETTAKITRNTQKHVEQAVFEPFSKPEPKPASTNNGAER